jgi:hypothetical protein
MDNKHQENGALRGPLIFTLPAFNFVVILSFDWLDGANWAAVSVKTHGWNYPATRPRTAKEFASGVLNQGRWGTASGDFFASFLPSFNSSAAHSLYCNLPLLLYPLYSTCRRYSCAGGRPWVLNRGSRLSGRSGVIPLEI